jgi:hypothetical protein
MLSKNGTTFPDGTPEALVAVLENARLAHRRVRIHYGDLATGRDWLEEHDVEGYVTRTCGPIKAPMLLYSGRSIGGSTILLANVLKITAPGLERRNRRRVLLWQAPYYQRPVLSLMAPSDLPGYAASVNKDGHPIARFKTVKAARRYIGKMEDCIL